MKSDPKTGLADPDADLRRRLAGPFIADPSTAAVTRWLADFASTHCPRPPPRSEFDGVCVIWKIRTIIK